MSLISLSEYKDFLQIPSPDTTKDLMIARLAGEVEDWFQTYTNRDLSPTSHVILLNGTGTDSIVVPYKPVVSIDLLEILDVIGYTIITYGPGNLRLDPPSGRIKLQPTPNMFSATSLPISIIVPRGKLNVRVTYTSGYTNIPPGMKLTLKRLVAFFLDPTTVGMTTKKRFGDIEFDARIRNYLPADLRLQLQGYRRILI